MKTALDLKNDMMASLWIKPCTFEELCVRLNVPQFGTWSIIQGALKNKLLYERGERLYCYKATALKLNRTGDYELDV